jgi:GFO/IDH/MocA oxidoreductase family protein
VPISRRKFLGVTTLAAPVGLGLVRRLAGRDDSLRLGLVGRSARGNLHLSAASLIPGIQVVAICSDGGSGRGGDTGPQRRSGNSPALVPGPAALFEDRTIEGVIVAVPLEQRAAVAIAALEAGKHVLLEVPFATAAEGASVLRTARARGLVALPVLGNRCDPQSADVLHRLRRGDIGLVTLARFFVGARLAEYTGGLERRQDPEALLAGRVLDRLDLVSRGLALIADDGTLFPADRTWHYSTLGDEQGLFVLGWQAGGRAYTIEMHVEQRVRARGRARPNIRALAQTGCFVGEAGVLRLNATDLAEGIYAGLPREQETLYRGFRELIRSGKNRHYDALQAAIQCSRLLDEGFWRLWSAVPSKGH